MTESLEALKDRIRVLEEENAKLRSAQVAVANANAHSAELMVALEEAKDELSDRNHQLQSLLDNVQCGFLVVDRELVVSPVVTRSCERLFGRPNVAGGYLPDVLGLDSSEAEALMLAVDEVFSDILPEEVTLEQLPRRFVAGQRVLDFAGTAMRDGDGDVVGLLFSVFDVTLLEQESKEVALSHALISILKRRDAFRGFVGEAKRLLDTGRQALFHGDETVVRRVLHTLKGMFGCYALSDLSALIHDLEAQARLPKSSIATVESQLDGFLRAHEDVLQLGLDGDEGECCYPVTAADLSALMAVADRPEEVVRWAAWARCVPVSTLLGPLAALVTHLAQRLGKQARLTVSGDDVRMDEERLLPVLRELPHLLRNAVAHGIEPQGGRGDKPAVGVVDLRFADRDGTLVVTVRDDGMGIDEARVRAAAGARADTRHGLIDLLSLDGVSTSTEVSDISGRGVGIASVRASVEALGGSLDVASEPGRGTTFTLVLPAERADATAELNLVAHG